MSLSSNRTAQLKQPNPRRTGFGKWQPGQQNEAYFFLLPSLLGFAVFVLVPILGAFVLSFFRWNLIGTPDFVALRNYQELIFQDAVFRKVLGNTFFYALTIVPLQLVFGLLMAIALNQGIRGLELYRLIYFMPVVTNIVAVAIVFQWLLNRDFGVANAWVWQLAD
ncbi:MAG: sugar ABC transporter permease, partial [Deinococcota bacterium]